MPKRQPYEIKTLPAAFVTKKDATQGIVEAVVSVTGVADFHDDIIVAGAFKKTIVERGLKVKVLNHHNSWSVNDVIGVCLEMREVGRDGLPEEVLVAYPDATGGLVTRTQYLMDTPEGAGAFARINAGAIDEYSIGFRCLQYEWKKMEDGRVLRLIKEVQLYEYSPVIWGANPATATVGVKSNGERLSRRTHAATDMAEAAATALKAGRVLSAANAAKLKTALDALMEVLSESGVLGEDDTVEEEEPDSTATSNASKSAEKAGPSPTEAETPTSQQPAPEASALEVKRQAMLDKIRQSQQA